MISLGVSGWEEEREGGGAKPKAPPLPFLKADLGPCLNWLDILLLIDDSHYLLVLVDT